MHTQWNSIVDTVICIPPGFFMLQLVFQQIKCPAKHFQATAVFPYNAEPVILTQYWVPRTTSISRTPSGTDEYYFVSGVKQQSNK